MDVNETDLRCVMITGKSLSKAELLP